jgi:hypothetical protein
MKTFLIPLLFATIAHAQAPANSVLVGAEGITITACSATNCTYEFGAGTTYNVVANPKLPLVVSCSTPCPQLGNDPLPRVAKSIYIVQQASAFTVTVAGLATPIKVPALAAPPPPPVTPVKQWSCTGVVLYSLMSDSTFQVTNSGALTCTETK